MWCDSQFESASREQELLQRLVRLVMVFEWEEEGPFIEDTCCLGASLETADLDAVFLNRHWSQISIEEYVLYQSAISFFTSRALYHFLPGFILAARESDIVFEKLVYGLDDGVAFDLAMAGHDDALTSVHDLLVSKQQEYDEFPELASALTKIERFLKLNRKAGDDEDLC